MTDAEIERLKSEITSAAQTLPATPTKAQQTVATTTADTPAGWWSVNNAMTVSSAVLIFGLIVLTFATYLVRTGSPHEGVLRIMGTIVILVGAVFLVVAGYSDTQIAPVVGLLGTIAGYLLGRESSHVVTPAKPDKQN